MTPDCEGVEFTLQIEQLSGSADSSALESAISLDAEKKAIAIDSDDFALIGQTASLTITV